jgi:hypothetical protein
MLGDDLKRKAHPRRNILSDLNTLCDWYEKNQPALKRIAIGQADYASLAKLALANPPGNEGLINLGASLGFRGFTLYVQP